MVNSNEFWFRRRKGLFTKDLGWGYMPINWKGWLSLLVWILFAGLFAIRFNIFQETQAKSDVIRFIASICVWVALLVWFCEKKTDKTA